MNCGILQVYSHFNFSDPNKVFDTEDEAADGGSIHVYSRSGR